MYHTNCDDAQTDQRPVWSYFPLIKISSKQSQSQKRYEARDVLNAQTDLSLRHSQWYKCHFSCTCTAQLDPDHTACVTKFTL